MEKIARHLSGFLCMTITTTWLWDKGNRTLIKAVLKEIIEYGNSDARAVKAAKLYREVVTL